MFSDDQLFRDTLEGTLLDFAEESDIYDQVRFLDPKGMDIVRVNWVDGQVIALPKDQLQDKSGRYYFQESRNLKFEEIYISKFDLNLEHEKIETPEKPVYRLITPVDLDDGSRIGYIVLNIIGEPLLKRIRGANQIITGKLFLINNAGDWLIGPEGTISWGFMYPDAKKSNIAETFPEIWNKYQGGYQFQEYSSNGLFSFRLINPFDRYQTINNVEVQGVLP